MDFKIWEKFFLFLVFPAIAGRIFEICWYSRDFFWFGWFFWELPGNVWNLWDFAIFGILGIMQKN